MFKRVKGNVTSEILINRYGNHCDFCSGGKKIPKIVVRYTSYFRVPELPCDCGYDSDSQDSCLLCELKGTWRNLKRKMFYPVKWVAKFLEWKVTYKVPTHIAFKYARREAR